MQSSSNLSSETGVAPQVPTSSRPMARLLWFLRDGYPSANTAEIKFGFGRLPLSPWPFCHIFTLVRIISFPVKLPIDQTTNYQSYSSDFSLPSSRSYLALHTKIYTTNSFLFLADLTANPCTELHWLIASNNLHWLKQQLYDLAMRTRYWAVTAVPHC